MYKIVNMENNEVIHISNDFMNHIYSAMEDYQEKFSSVGYINEGIRKQYLHEINQILDLLGGV